MLDSELRPPGEGESRRSRLRWVGPFAVALLVSSGQIKASPALVWLPFDLTLLSAGLVVAAIVHSRLVGARVSGFVLLPLVVWATFVPAVMLLPVAEAGGVKPTILFTVTLVLAVAPFFLMNDESQRRVFVGSLTSIAFLATLYGLFIDRTYESEFSDRLLLEGADTIGTARVALGGALVFLLLAASRRRFVWRAASVAAALIAVSFAVATGSRGPALAASAAIVFTVVVAPAFRPYRARAIAVVVLSGIALSSVLIANSSDGAGRILGLLLGEGDTSTLARQQLWAESIRRVLENPFGTGWGSFQYGSGSYTYPHNLLLELAVEAGVLVTALFVLVLVFSIVRAARSATTVTGSMLLALLVFATLSAMVSNDINGNRLLVACMFGVWALPSTAWGVQPRLGRTTGVRESIRSAPRAIGSSSRAITQQGDVGTKSADAQQRD